MWNEFRRVILLTAVGLVVIDGDARAGIDADTAINRPDQFNWELFAKISAPANDGTNNTIWETWARDSDTFPTSPNPNAPPVWPSKPDKVLTANRQVRFNRQQFQGPGATPFIGVSGGNEEVRRNKPTFDFIIQNGLWYTEGIAKYFASDRSISFTTDSIEVKAEWKPINEAEKPHYHWNVDSQNKLYGLVALHVISKVLPNWTWATFEHTDNPSRCDVIGCEDSFGSKQPITLPHATRGQTYAACEPTDALLAVFNANGLDRSVWKNYCLKGSQIEFRTAAGIDTRLGNSRIELPFMETSSCMTCHVRAFAGPDGENVYGAGFKGRNLGYIGPPEPDWFYVTTSNVRTRKGVQTDFIWAIPFCASSLTAPNNTCSP
jgi:hypothetical protein